MVEAMKERRKVWVILLQISDRGKVSSVCLLLCLFVLTVELMCMTGCPLSWRPFTETWRRVGVVTMPSWCPMVCSV